MSQDVGQGGLAQTRRSAEQDVGDDVSTLPGGFHHQHESLSDFLLSEEILELAGPERQVERGLRSLDGACVKRVTHGDC
jgi:hypothetical protein